MGEWAELTEQTPGLSVPPVVRETNLRLNYGDYPGFAEWLNTQHALGFSSSRIKARLDLIRADQEAEGDQPWPRRSKREIDIQKRNDAHVWQPLRANVSRNIEAQGVLNKNNRLMALLRMAEELDEKMWDERNIRTNQLYLQGEYRAVLKQIAEEKGELGETDSTTESKLIDLARILAEAMKIQGSGVQLTSEDNTFDYWEEGDYEEAPLLSQSTDLQTDEVQAE